MLNAGAPADQAGAILRGLGTALPRHRATQAQVARFLSLAAQAQPRCSPRLLRLLETMAERSGVAYRNSVIGDYAGRDPDAFEMYPPDWRLDPFPTASGTTSRR